MPVRSCGDIMPEHWGHDGCQRDSVSTVLGQVGDRMDTLLVLGAR